MSKTAISKVIVSWYGTRLEHSPRIDRPMMGSVHTTWTNRRATSALHSRPDPWNTPGSILSARAWAEHHRIGSMTPTEGLQHRNVMKTGACPTDLDHVGKENYLGTYILIDTSDHPPPESKNIAGNSHPPFKNTTYHHISSHYFTLFLML